MYHKDSIFKTDAINHSAIRLLVEGLEPSSLINFEFITSTISVTQAKLNQINYKVLKKPS